MGSFQGLGDLFRYPESLVERDRTFADSISEGWIAARAQWKKVGSDFPLKLANAAASYQLTPVTGSLPRRLSTDQQPTDEVPVAGQRSRKLLRKNGEPPGTRTPNPQIKSLLLCQLS